MRITSSCLLSSGKVFQQLARFALPCLMALWAQTALAVPVRVVPGAYAGSWKLAHLEWSSGERTVELEPGSYVLHVGARGGLYIHVASDGAVSTSNPVAVTGNALGELSFHTVTVDLDPASYTGIWSLERSTGRLQGRHTVDVVPGLTYLVRVGGYGAVLFDVAADGTVNSLSPASATASSHTLTLLSVPIAFDPQLYGGIWGIDGAYGAVKGARTFTLVPGLKYYLGIGGWGGIRFDVAADGTVSTQAAASATASGSTLILKTTPVTLYPRDYAGNWSIENVFANQPHTATVQLVPAVQYHVYVGAVGGFHFFVEPQGTVSTQVTASATPAGSALVFNTVPVRIAPRDPAQAWSLNLATAPLPVPWTGTHTLKLVPGVKYRLQAGGASADFTVESPCALSPTYLAIGSAGFDLGCTP
jgi:hypothetical protein